MRISTWSLVGTWLCLSACGGGEQAGQSFEWNDTGDELTLNLGPLDVPVGDVFECYYTPFTTEEMLPVVRSWGKQGSGGHHIAVFYTDNPRPVGHHPCQDAEMVDWHLVAGTAGDNGGSGSQVIRIPEGLAFKLLPGKQVVVQLHYINASGAVEHVNDNVTLETVAESDVESYVNYMFFSYEAFDVPAGARYESVSTCTVPRDLQTILLLGHMHEFGESYSLDEIDGSGQFTSNLYEQDEWAPSFASHPPLQFYEKDDPLLLAEGTRLRQTCRWNNYSDENVLFPREMCVGIALYYPDDGELDCKPDQDTDPSTRQDRVLDPEE
jgi:hypothetical protein